VRCIVDSPFNTTRAHAPAERCRQLVACVTLSGIMPQMAHEPMSNVRPGTSTWLAPVAGVPIATREAR